MHAKLVVDERHYGRTWGFRVLHPACMVSHSRTAPVRPFVCFRGSKDVIYNFPQLLGYDGINWPSKTIINMASAWFFSLSSCDKREIWLHLSAVLGLERYR